MTSNQKFRGSSVRLTLPHVLHFSALWLVVTILAVIVLAVTTYLLFFDRLTDVGRQRLVIVLGLQALLTILAMVALAIFTTHRLAGPIIAIERALEDVRDGHLDRTLTFRSSDRHLREVEARFEEMTAALRQRLGEPQPPQQR